jgi:hypothetical protein
VLARPQPKIREIESSLVDLKDIKGQESAKRALEVAAAGGHNLVRLGYVTTFRQTPGLADSEHHRMSVGEPRGIADSRICALRLRIILTAVQV